MNSSVPIRSRAAEEGNFEIPLWGVPLVLLVLYICLFSGLGALGLVGPDEPRYAAIARAMAETHDWVTPRLWGTPWFEKPVLYYWTAGVAMRLFGVSEFTARLPSALAALLAVVAIAWTALRSYGLGAAWYSLLMLPTSVAVIGFSRAASPDMLFAGFLTAAMAVAYEMLQKPRPGNLLRFAFGFFLGAAVLAKGPAAVILAGGATLLWAGLCRQWLPPFRFLHPLVLAVFCATALPWYVLCASRNPDFLRVFIWQHNFERYLTPVFQHRQPFWFYIPVLLLASFPWCLPALSGFRAKADRGDWRGSPGMFAFCWAFFPFLFFSFSESKLPGYILPAVPPAFLLMSRATARLLASDARWSAIWVGITGAIFIFIPAVTMHAITLQDLYKFPGPGVAELLLAAAAGGVVVTGFSLSRKPWVAFTAVVGLVVALIVLIDTQVLPAADAHLSARRVAQYSLALIPSKADVEVYALSRDWNYGLSYYFDRELPERATGAPLPDWLFTSDRQAVLLVKPGDRIYWLNDVAPDIVLIHPAAKTEVGR